MSILMHWIVEERRIVWKECPVLTKIVSRHHQLARHATGKNIGLATGANANLVLLIEDYVDFQ